MALVVTPGASNADSYYTLAELVTAAADIGLTYTASPDDEPAARRATLWLDANFRYKWPGERTNGRGQSREWPRVNATDLSGEDILSTEIPQEVKNAQLFAWYYEKTQPLSLTPKFITGKEKVLIEMEGLKWKPLFSATAPADMKPTLFLVENALSGLISFHKSPFFGVV